MKYKPYDYQKYAEQKILDLPSCGLFLQMGLGKTPITLTAIDKLMYELFEVGKVLVIAPLRVAEDTWMTEIEKWDHLKHLKLSKVLGSEAERKKALREKADIYVINRENVMWLVGLYGSAFPFDMVVIDELSSFKSAKSQRFKALKQVITKARRVVGLTGTPAPNSLIDLWSQVYLLDQGKRLEKTITAYRTKYFTPGRSNGHVVYEYKPLKTSHDEIYNKISDICVSMKAEDYLTLPERIDVKKEVVLSSAEMAKYVELEKQMILELPDGEITALNAAALTNKLLQLGNGAVYDANRSIFEIHNKKLEALEEIIDVTDESILVFYSYKHDFERINDYLRRYKPKQLNNSQDIRDWNEGKIRLLLAHPASCGHGLNLQAGGNVIVWFGLTWSLELYQQANARLYRQGQKNNVIVHHLIAKNTMDEAVMEALKDKARGQDALMEAVKARIRRYKE